MTTPTPPLAELLDRGAAFLLRHGVPPDEARAQTELLAGEALRLPPLTLTLHRAERPSPAAVAALRAMLLRRARGEPLQYILGRWPFHDVTLRVSPAALIPRPETEGLVERVLAHPRWRDARVVADVGTGTGAIALALAHAAARQGLGKTFLAIDLSPAALALARQNAADLRLGVTFLQADGLSSLPPASCDLIVSNPPYIPSAQVDALPAHIRDHEPRLALDGGPDGLDVIRQLILDATLALRPGGCLFLEIGEDQGLAVRRLLDRAGYTAVAVARDLAGHDRYAEGALP